MNKFSRESLKVINMYYILSFKLSKFMLKHKNENKNNVIWYYIHITKNNTKCKVK